MIPVCQFVIIYLFVNIILGAPMLTYTAVRLYNLIIVTNGADEVVIPYCLLSYYSYLLYIIKGLYLADYKIISHFHI